MFFNVRQGPIGVPYPLICKEQNLRRVEDCLRLAGLWKAVLSAYSGGDLSPRPVPLSRPVLPWVSRLPVSICVTGLKVVVVLPLIGLVV